MLQRDSGLALLDEIRLESFRLYNSREVMRLDTEMAYVSKKINEMKQQAAKGVVNEELSVNFVLLKSYHDRCLRIRRAYIWYRIRVIEQNYFKKEDIQDLMSADELAYKNRFTELLDEYLSEYRHLDLVHRDVPLNFYVQIFTLEDCGLVMCGKELMDLKKHRIYFLKRSDVAHLLDRQMARII